MVRVAKEEQLTVRAKRAALVLLANGSRFCAMDENEKRGWKVIPTSLILVDWRERIKRQVL